MFHALLMPIAFVLPGQSLDTFSLEAPAHDTNTDMMAEQSLEIASSDDPFSSFDSMSVEVLQEKSGGSASAFDDSYILVQGNLGQNGGTISDTSISDTQTGYISGTVVTGNRGVTTVYVNSGNNVIFQNIFNVNAASR
ncbi:MAG: hypothetical protein AAF603_00810 [Pseudomonadota bacterium]